MHTPQDKDMPQLSVEQMVRNILEAAKDIDRVGNRDPQELSAGDIVAASNLLLEYLRKPKPPDTSPPAPSLP